MLNYRLNRKQHLNIQKKTQKTTTTEKPLRLKRALKSEEGMAGGRKTGHHVLPINTNTTFNSTASVLFCTTTHMRNVPRAHTRHPVADNTLTLCCHTKSFRGACEQKKKKNLLILYIYIYISIYLFIHILIYKNKTIIKSIESQIYWSSVNRGKCFSSPSASRSVHLYSAPVLVQSRAEAQELKVRLRHIVITPARF